MENSTGWAPFGQYFGIPEPVETNMIVTVMYKSEDNQEINRVRVLFRGVVLEFGPSQVEPAMALLQKHQNYSELMLTGEMGATRAYYKHGRELMLALGPFKKIRTDVMNQCPIDELAAIPIYKRTLVENSYIHPQYERYLKSEISRMEAFAQTLED